MTARHTHRPSQTRLPAMWIAVPLAAAALFTACSESIVIVVRDAGAPGADSSVNPDAERRDAHADATAQTDATASDAASDGGEIADAGTTDALPDAGQPDATTDPCENVTCDTPRDACHTAPGTCTGGLCSYPPANQGTQCDDGDACTDGDLCDGAGNCAPGTNVCPEMPCAVGQYACVIGCCAWTVEEGPFQGDPMDVATYTSMALDSSNRPRVAACDWNRGTLRYGKYNGLGATPLWTFVDLNSGGPEFPNDWPQTLFGCVTRTLPSLALDESDNPYLATLDLYPLVAYEILGGWTSMTIDDSHFHDKGFTSVAVDVDSNGTGYVHYVYAASPESGEAAELGYAVVHMSGGVAQNIQRKPIGQTRTKLANQLLVLDGAGSPHVAYAAETGELMVAVLPSFDGTWNIETVDARTVFGDSISLAIDDAGREHIAYYNPTNADLEYAVHSGSPGWELRTIDNGGDVGRWASIAVAPDGWPHVAYRDETHHRLKYAAKTSTGWVLSIVDGIEGGDAGPGRFASLRMDTNGNPHMVYAGYWGGTTILYAHR